jgi:hypothetical protein
MLKGLIKVHDSFDDPLPPDIAAAFGIIDEPSDPDPRPDRVIKK